MSPSPVGLASPKRRLIEQSYDTSQRLSEYDISGLSVERRQTNSHSKQSSNRLLF